jgi:hypothetical protein
MSLEQIENTLLTLSPEERRRFAQWFYEHEDRIVGPGAAESEVVKSELLRRRQEYRDHPERFEHMDEAALERMFQDIENEKR